MKTGIITMLALLSCACSVLESFAADPLKRPGVSRDAEIVTVRGDSTVRLVPLETWEPARQQQPLTAGDTIKTGVYGKLDLLFADGTQIKVHHKTVLTIRDVKKTSSQKGTSVGLQVGEIWARAKTTPDSLKIITPSATAAIRGTDWDIAVDEQGASRLVVLKGSVELANDFGTVAVAAGETALAEVGKAPVKMVLVRPKDRVQWTSSYSFDIPRIVTFPPFLPEDPGTGAAALTFKGMTLLDQGDTDGAATHFERVLQGGGESAFATEAALGLADVAVRRNDPARAEAILERLYKEHSTALAGIALATFRAYLGDFGRALEVCRESAKNYPADERFLTLAADFLLTLDDAPQARAVLDSSLAVNPFSSRTHAIRGRYFYLDGNGREAEFAYRSAVALDPANTAALSELGRLLMERGHYEEAGRLLDRAVAQAPLLHSGWSRKAQLMNWVDDLRGAERDFSRALQLNPADYESLDGRGYLALKEGRTGEAVASFRKAGTIEPKFAQPHIFLAIAHYQSDEVDKALEELRLAEVLDPKDPLPHMVAYIIYNDTYRPFLAINEAGRALELLPNLKSVNPIEKTQEGLSNLGAALLGLGMTEWASSYAEESFDPFDASGYFFVSKKYDSNPFVYVSENVQGFLMDPLAIGQHYRYQDIVARPYHNLRVNTTIADEGGSFSHIHKATQQGFLRQPFDVKYLLDFERTDRDGFRKNGFQQDNFLTYAFSAKPDYQNGLILFGGLRDKRYGDPGPDHASYEANDSNRLFAFELDAGYNHRFAHKNNLLFNFRYSRTELNYRNPDPYGTGLNDAQLSLVQAFGLEGARSYLKQGVFDFTNESTLMGPWNSPYYGTDSTGLVRDYAARIGAIPVSANIPARIDPNSTVSSKGIRESYNYQLKHLFQAGDRHQLAWGVEYTPTYFQVQSTFSSNVTDTATFREDYLLWSQLGTPNSWLTIPAMHIQNYDMTLNQDSTFVGAYLQDRWKACDNLLVDAGLFFEYFSNKLNNNRDFNPRLGLAWTFHRNHILRAAYQKRTLEAFDMTLAPVTTAGLFFDWIQLYPGSRISDYQATVESRWNERLFTSVGYEIRDYKNPDFGYALFARKNRAAILTAAANTILTDTLGVYVRYKYVDSRNHDEIDSGKATPLIPKHTLGAGLVYVSPRHFKAALSTSYSTGQYGDEANLYRMPELWTTDFSASWEPLKKHLLVGFDLKNIFDRKYETEKLLPAVGRSVALKMEYRF